MGEATIGRAAFFVLACAGWAGCTVMNGYTIPLDGGGAVDSGAGAVDAAAAPFCGSQAQPPMFCDDFDDESALTPRWDGLDNGASTVVRIDRAQFRSPDASLLSSLPAGPDSCRFARVNKDFSGGYRRSTVGLAYHFDAPGSLANAVIVSQELYFDGGHCVAAFRPSPATGGPSVVETVVMDDGGQETTTWTSNAGAPAAGVWHRAVIDYDVDGNVTLTNDGVKVIDQPRKFPCGGGALHAHHEIGINCDGNTSSALGVHIDDVTIDAR